MRVKIDEARQRVMPLEIQHAVAFLGFWAPAVFDGDAGIPDVGDGCDAVTLDDDVHGPQRRRPFTVDDGKPSQDEPAIRTLTLCTVRRDLGGGQDVDRPGGHYDRKYRQDQVLSHFVLALCKNRCYSID